MSAVLTGLQITRFQLATIKSGVKLEAKGMKISRGKSCTQRARQILNLPASTSREELLEGLEKAIEELQ